MPTDEFFNTGIYTYLWIFNKNKPADRKDKLILIDGSNHWEQLKKSKGKKRRQMNQKHRNLLVDAFTAFQDNEFAKVFDKWNFYYNKQAIMLTNIDENGKAVEMPRKINRAGNTVEAKSIKVDFSSVAILNTFEEEKMKTINESMITEFDKEKYKNLKAYYDSFYKNYVSGFDYKEEGFVLIDKNGNSYHYDSEINSIIRTDKNQNITELGNGKINVKTSYKKATKTKEAQIVIITELTKDLEKDYEIIQHSPDDAINQQNIADFMAKYVNRPFKYLDNVVGVELNFNKIFYQPVQLRSVAEITTDIDDLENDLKQLEADLAL